MIAMSLVILSFSGDGYWFGGQPGSVTFTWAAAQPRADAVVRWSLWSGELRLAEGDARLPADQDTASLLLTPPEVRVRLALELRYEVRSVADEAVIAQGRQPIHVFPRNLLAGRGKRLEGRSLVVWDDKDELSAVLREAGVEHERIDSHRGLRLRRIDLLLVGRDQISGAAFDQAGLVGHAMAGTSVMVLAQSGLDHLAGYPLRTRDLGNSVRSTLTYRHEHPLLSGFTADDLYTFERSAGESVVIELPIDAPVLELVYWPRETDSAQPAPIDALLATQTVGAGRLVLCQWAPCRWIGDPRGQLFLAAAIDYLLSRPEPTVSPSKRLMPVIIQPPATPHISIPSGDQP